jgi:glycosyltransferase involved in cell wall biosynthesis
MHLILVADNASTRFGGEAFLPFNYFKLLTARGVDVRLVVHARTRAELVGLFPDHLDRLHFVDDTWLHKTFFHLGTFLPRRLADATTGLIIHLTTQFAQRKIIQNLVDRLVDVVVHQPTPVSPKIPSLIFGFGVPVVIGPLNGGMDYPQSFKRNRGSLSNVALVLGRGVANLANAVIPGKCKADLILVANRRTRDALPPGVMGTVSEMVDNGVDFSIWRKKDRFKSDDQLKLVFVGRLIDLKAVDLVIEVVHRLREKLSVSLEVIGEGPMRENWENLSKALGVTESVRFSGFLSQDECSDRLLQSDIFVMPSIHDCGGAVVLEAMATGLPVVATAWGGPLDYLDETCGILVEPSSREALIEGFSNAIVRLGESPSLREQMGQAGYERARQKFDWERKIDRMLELYASVN